MWSWKFFVVGALALVLAAGCDPNNSGRVRASRTGATSDVPAPTRPFDEALYEACGSEASVGADIRRGPYLQKLGATAGSLLWTAAEHAAYTLELTRADGASSASFGSRVEETAHLTSAVQQVVDFSGLQASTRYCYTLSGPDGTVRASSGLRTAPAADSGETVSFVAFGDSGYGGSDQRSVLAALQERPFDLVLVTGDVAYPFGALGSYEHSFFEVYGGMLASVAVFPIPGNHDYDTAGGAPYREVFSLPENGGGEGLERWYSFDWGDVHFVALDSERVGPAQAAWLEADLTSNLRPWTVAMIHKSPYSSGEHGNNATIRDQLSPIFERFGVPLVLAGHDHDYERSEPINGVTYVVTGGGGRGTRPVGESSFTAFSEEVLHFVYVTVEHDDLRMYAIDATGQEFDFAHIERSR